MGFSRDLASIKDNINTLRVALLATNTALGTLNTTNLATNTALGTINTTVNGISQITPTTWAPVGKTGLVRVAVPGTVVAAGEASLTLISAVPSGAKLVGWSYINETLVVLGGGGVTLNYVINDGGANGPWTVGTGVALTKNTKNQGIISEVSATAITGGVTSVTVAPDAGTITTGTMTFVLVYDVMTAPVDIA